MRVNVTCYTFWQHTEGAQADGKIAIYVELYATQLRIKSYICLIHCDNPSLKISNWFHMSLL